VAFLFRHVAKCHTHTWYSLYHNEEQTNHMMTTPLETNHYLWLTRHHMDTRPAIYNHHEFMMNPMIDQLMMLGMWP